MTHIQPFNQPLYTHYSFGSWLAGFCHTMDDHTRIFALSNSTFLALLGKKLRLF